MQQRNYVLFLVLSLAVFLSWQWVMQLYWPPPSPKGADYSRLARLPPAERRELVARTILALGGNAAGAENPLRAASDMMLAEQLLQEKDRLADRPPEPEPEPPVPDTPAQTIALGNETFNVKAVLTSRGAAVENLVLTRFKAADRTGRPMGTEMDLIPGDAPAAQREFADPWLPANLLYHYAENAGERPEHPLATLGKMNWAIASHRRDDDEHEVAFTADIPRRGVRVTKTYTPGPV